LRDFKGNHPNPRCPSGKEINYLGRGKKKWKRRDLGNIVEKGQAVLPSLVGLLSRETLGRGFTGATPKKAAIRERKTKK